MVIIYELGVMIWAVTNAVHKTWTKWAHVTSCDIPFVTFVFLCYTLLYCYAKVEIGPGTVFYWNEFSW